MPVAGAWISCVKLYISISTTGSPTLTESPTRLNHRPTDNFEAPAIFGTFISVPIASLISSPSARARPARGECLMFAQSHRGSPANLRRPAPLTNGPDLVPDL